MSKRADSAAGPAPSDPARPVSVSAADLAAEPSPNDGPRTAEGSERVVKASVDSETGRDLHSDASSVIDRGGQPRLAKELTPSAARQPVVSANSEARAESSATWQDGGESRRSNPWRRWWVRGSLVIGFAVLVTLAMQVWQERSLHQARTALSEGDLKYAHFLLTRFLRQHPGHEEASALQARTLVLMGDVDGAMQLFGEVGAASAEDLHAWAQAFMMRQQWSQALPLLLRVLQLSPRDPHALYEAAACEVRLGRLLDGLQHARELTTVPGQEARAYVFVATILGDLGNHAEAVDAFAQVLKYEPRAENLQVTPAEFYVQQGRTYLRVGQPAQALLPLKKSVAAGESAEALVLLGNAALQLGEPDKAIQAWQRAVQLEPLQIEAREALANQAFQRSQAAEALQWLQPLADVPDLPASTAFLFQRAYTQLKDTTQAEKWRELTAQKRTAEERNSDLQSLMTDAPESFWARVIRAYRFAESGNWGEAELLMTRLLKEAPGEPFVIELGDAVYRRATLPSLDRLPLDHF